MSLPAVRLAYVSHLRRALQRGVLSQAATALNPVFMPRHSVFSRITPTTSISRTLCTSSPPKSPSTNPQLHMVFTCTNCDTRSVKSFAKSSYEKGVVLVQCPGCDKRHVIADHLGWFGPEKNVEEILAKKGESVRVITDVDLGDDLPAAQVGDKSEDGAKAIGG